MSPLLYLLICRIKNGVTRSFKTPVRGFMTVLIAGYLVFALAAFLGLSTRPIHLPAGTVPMDPRISVAFFTIAHLILLFFIVPSPKYTVTIVTEIDIANLYQTPLERWRVARFFLFTRSFVSIFVFVGLLIVYVPFLLRLVIPSLVASIEIGAHTGRLLFHGAMVLFALAGLLFWRLVLDVRQSFGLLWKNAFRTGMSVFIIIVVGVVGYHVSRADASGLDPLFGLYTAVESFPLIVLLAPFRVLAEVFLNRIDHTSASLWLALIFWIAVCGTGYVALRSHSRFLYEYAARLAAFRAQLVAHAKNPVVLLKKKASEGKQVLRLPWIIRALPVKRSGAIIWRDLIIAWRSYGLLLKGLHYFLLLGVVATWFAVSWYHVVANEKVVWIMSACAMLLITMPFTSVAVTSLSNVLRKADVQKPMPISAMRTVTMHCLPWTVITCSITFLPAVVGMILFSEFWYVFVFVLTAGWSFVYTVVSAHFWVTLQNPDQEDPIQRIYTALFGLLLSIVVSSPAAVLLVVCKLLHVPLAAILFVVVSVNLAVTRMLQHFSARKYVNFVPTE